MKPQLLLLLVAAAMAAPSPDLEQQQDNKPLEEQLPKQHQEEAGKDERQKRFLANPAVAAPAVVSRVTYTAPIAAPMVSHIAYTSPIAIPMVSQIAYTAPLLHGGILSSGIVAAAPRILKREAPLYQGAQTSIVGSSGAIIIGPAGTLVSGPSGSIQVGPAGTLVVGPSGFIQTGPPILASHPQARPQQGGGRRQ
jgi:hypothetical protein